MNSNINSPGYSKIKITQITPTNELTHAVFVDDTDGEIVVQLVVVWAVLEFYTTYGDKEELVKTSVRGLTELPETPYLSDNILWDDNFVGYLRELKSDKDNRLMNMVANYKRKDENEQGRDEQGRTYGDPPEGDSPEGDYIDNIITTKPNFWSGKGTADPSNWND